MQPERLEKIKPLIAAVLRKPPAERESFLRQICGDDEELRRDINSFLNHKADTDPSETQGDTVPNAHISSDPSFGPVTSEVPPDPRIGKQFGKYLIRGRLAEGGMGIVYLAIDTQLGREVAVKILPEYFSMDRERLSRFRREARATSLLNHPHIVTVFEMGQLDGCEYIVTEYVEGRTLRDLMRQGQIPFVEILKIASQVAGALSAAHKAGIVHRDIKPENVMIRPDGYVKVLDFGLAKLSDATRKAASGDISLSGISKTTPGMIMGTVSYMSPEQAEGLETDARTDIWALGVMLYEMVSGNLPFKGPTTSHTIVAILEQEPAPIETASPELKQLISTALQKHREHRFQTATAMLESVDDLKHRLGYISDQNVSNPSTTAQLMSAPSFGPAPRTYRRILWVAPALLAILLLGSVAVYATAGWFGWLLNFVYHNEGGEATVNNTVPSASVTPSATPFEQIVIPSPTPTATVAYVDPTPEPTPEAAQPRPTPRPRPERRITEPRRTPRKPQPKADPNCVFTNTC